MKATIIGNALVITSSIKKETIEQLDKYNPAALMLCEGEGENKELLFKVSTHKTHSAVSNFGITFNGTNAEGEAQATLLLDNTPFEKRAAYVKDTFGMGLYRLAQLEARVEAAATDIANQLAIVEDAIEVR